MNAPKMSFEEWIEEVKKQYNEIAGFLPDPFNPDDFKDAWADGYSPKELVEEDLSYGD